MGEDKSTGRGKDQQAQDAVEETGPTTPGEANPPAGPHAAKDLTDNSKTPGTGLLPDPDQATVTAGSG